MLCSKLTVLLMVDMDGTDPPVMDRKAAKTSHNAASRPPAAKVIAFIDHCDGLSPRLEGVCVSSLPCTGMGSRGWLFSLLDPGWNHDGTDDCDCAETGDSHLDSCARLGPVVSTAVLWCCCSPSRGSDMALWLLTLDDLIFEMLGMPGEVDPGSSLGERSRPMFAGQSLKKECQEGKMQYGTNGRRGECHGISCQDKRARHRQNARMGRGGRGCGSR